MLQCTVQKHKINTSQLKFQCEIFEKTFVRIMLTQIIWEVAKQSNKHVSFQNCAIKIRTDSSCSLENSPANVGNCIIDPCVPFAVPIF